MSRHNLSDFGNEEPQVAETAETEANAEVEVETKTGEEGETLELTELAEGEEAETGENGTGEAEGEKRKKPIQERFDKLVARAKDAERDAEYWRAKALEKQPAEPEAKEAEGSDRPDPADFEFGDADPAYWEALTDWKAGDIVDKKLGQLTQQQAVDRQIQQLETTYAQNVAAVKEELPDYDEVVTKAAARQEFKCSEVVSLLAKQSPVGPKILYDLAQHPDEADQLASLPPIVQAAAFGAMVAHVSAQSETKPETKVTQAPPPPNFRTRGSGGQYETSERSMYRKMLKEFR